jgi:hypothetical protein
LAVFSQGSNGVLLVVVHQATIADNVGAKDCGEFAFKTFLDHGVTYFYFSIKTQIKTQKENVKEECQKRCQAQLDCTNETSFRLGTERNV